MQSIEASAKSKQKVVDIGGQAVLEGVMMKAPHAIAIAVRKPDGEIVVDCEPYTPLGEKHKWMGWPLVRGCVNMVSMLKLGMQTLQKSTAMLGVMEEEPNKFEEWLARKLGKNIDKVVMGLAGILAVALAMFLFIMLPSAAGALINRAVSSPILVNLCTGVVRIIILVAYISLMSLLPDLRRVFQYHGAEHKTVYCHEHKLPLTPQNAQGFSTLHPRCGTSFLLLVMVISILLAAVADQLIMLIGGVEKLGFWARIARSLLILPLVTGLSYEALKGLAHRESPFVRALRWPGLMMQKLTTRQPDEGMLEVAIASMQAALARSEQVEAALARSGQTVTQAQTACAADRSAPVEAVAQQSPDEEAPLAKQAEE